ncbi:chymotrypsin-2-like [Tetranychus urticae]|uniref:Peptidase S1 domain-containing protein n=1 Tax=Tetranychus urticae TaxID=32264 RepID=T1JRG4_TETUR|nr:chymotrypsin-2-like [Tetranychus urticae]
MINSEILMIILFLNYVSSTDIDNQTEFQERIVWGQYVYTAGAYPYYMSLLLPDREDQNKYIANCGGSLVESRMVVTAAHCLMNPSANKLYRIFPNYRNTPFIEKNDLFFKISRYVVHPDFDFKVQPFSAHDIAVILMDQPYPGVTLTIPAKSPAICTETKLMGFGIDEYSGDPDRMKEATVLTLTDRECSMLLSKYEYSPGNNFCTINIQGSAGCVGDSGGPLVWENPKNNKTYLFGVVSAGRGHPCHRNPETIFVDVSKHKDFLSSAIYQLKRDELRSDQIEYI